MEKIKDSPAAGPQQMVCLGYWYADQMSDLVHAGYYELSFFILFVCLVIFHQKYDCPLHPAKNISSLMMTTPPFQQPVIHMNSS